METDNHSVTSKLLNCISNNLGTTDCGRSKDHSVDSNIDQPDCRFTVSDIFAHLYRDPYISYKFGQ